MNAYVRTCQCPEPPRQSLKAISSLRSSSQRQKRSSKSSNTSYTSNTGQTLKSSAYDRDFEQKCIDHGIHMPWKCTEPKNLQELQERLANPRSSLSPSKFSDGAFDRFCKAEAEARDEDDVIWETLPTILGEKRRDYPSAKYVTFWNIDDMAPDIFKKPRPDLYWGARLEQIDRRVRQDLNHQIVPSTNESYPVAPNFFLEAKGPDGSAAVKTRQACYGGAIGARTMQALQGYRQAEPTHDNRAYTFSSTYYDGALKLYSHHSAQPPHPDKPAEYYMTQLGGWDLSGSSQQFRDGVGAFRNARDLAREQRDMLIDQANAVARTQSAGAMSFDEAISQDTTMRTQSVDTMSFDEWNSQDTVTSLGRRLIDSDTSADELAFDPHPAISRTKRQKKA